MEDFSSLEATVRLLVDKGYVAASPSTFPHLMQDYWKRSFVWQVSRSHDATRIRIISRGPNGILEDGEGDDLFVEILIPRTGEPSWRANR